MYILKIGILIFLILFSVLFNDCAVNRNVNTYEEKHFDTSGFIIPFVLKNNRVVAEVVINDTITTKLFYDNNIGTGVFKLSLSSLFVNRYFKNQSFLKNVKVIDLLPVSGFSVSNMYSTDSIKINSLQKTITGYKVYSSQSLIANDIYDGIINFTDSLIIGNKIQEINFDEHYIRFLTEKEFEKIDLSEYLKFNFVLQNNNIVFKTKLLLTDCTGKEYIINGPFIWDLGNPNAVILNPKVKCNKDLFDYMENNCRLQKSTYYYLKGKKIILSFYQINKFSLFDENSVNKGISILSSPFNSDVLKNVSGILPVNLIKTYNYFVDMTNHIIYARKRKHMENLTFAEITNFWKLHSVYSKYVVILVKKGSPVDKAGIECQDTILKVNNRLPTYFDIDMLEKLDELGDTITVQYKREEIIYNALIYKTK